jgi:outer membrane protein insertion porin family
VYQDFVNEFGLESNSVPLTLGWARDTRDSAFVPSSGKVVRTSAEWSVAKELRYYRAVVQYQQFFPFSKKVTGAFNTDVSVGEGLEGRSFPVFKNFTSGGLGSVRGFEQGSLTTGPQRLNSLVATGGSQKITFNAEVLSPLPGGGNDRSLRMYAFVDTGGIFSPSESIKFEDFRSSYGVGISWVSPLGPLRLAFAQPIQRFENDRIQSIQFQIGTAF